MIRLGVAQSICARPLIYGLMRGAGTRYSLVYNEAAMLSDALSRGQLDAALIPSIEYLRGVGHFFVDGVALVARPSRGGLILVARKPPAELERVAVGEFCRTPLAALRIALAESHSTTPDLLVEKHLTPSWRDRYDAVLLSGDSVLQHQAAAPVDGDEVHDITEMWDRVAGGPLVVALWVYREAALGAELSKLLVSSRNLGIQNLSHLADGIAQSSQFGADRLYGHLSEAWSYDLRAEEMASLRVLEERALRYDLLRQGRLERAIVG